MKLPKTVTAFGLLLAVAAVLVDPAAAPWLSELLGPTAATKIAAAGALFASIGRALFAPAPAPAAPPADAPTDG